MYLRMVRYVQLGMVGWLGQCRLLWRLWESPRKMRIRNIDVIFRNTRANPLELISSYPLGRIPTS